MTYYTNEKLPFYVDGKLHYMTEEEAEEMQEENPFTDIQAGVEVSKPKLAGKDDDFINCTCADEHDICPACEKYFEEVAGDV